MRISQRHQYCRYVNLAIKNPDSMPELFAFFSRVIILRFVDIRWKLMCQWVMPEYTIKLLKRINSQPYIYFGSITNIWSGFDLNEYAWKWHEKIFKILMNSSDNRKYEGIRFRFCHKINNLMQSQNERRLKYANDLSYF